MRLSSRLKQKIGDGTFREMWQEAMWMFKYIRRYRLVVLIHIVLGVVSTVMGLLSSIGMKRMIDVVTGFYYGGFTGAAIYMVGMMVGSIVIGAFASRIAAIINIKVQNGIQAEVYDRMLRTDWESLEQFRSGDLLQRLNGDVGGVAYRCFIQNLLDVHGSLRFIRGSFRPTVFRWRYLPPTHARTAIRRSAARRLRSPLPRAG